MAKNLSTKVARSMFIKLLPMQIFAVGVLNINGILSSLIIGNLLGPDKLAVFGFIIPINFIHIMLGGGIASGSQILCGKYIGCGDRKSIGDTYATVSVLCIVIGVLLTAVYQLFAEPIASLLGAEGDALRYTADYIRGFGWSVIFMLFSSALIPFLQLNNASAVMYTAISVMTISNVLLDLLSISITDSMYGIGLAGTASYVLSDAVILLYYLSSKCPIHFSLKDSKWSCVKEIFRLGLPNMSRALWLSIRNVIFNNTAVGLEGTRAVTALAVQSNMGNIADAFGGGIDGSTNMVASIFYGERDKESLREASALALKIDGLIQVSVYIVLFIIAKPFARAFGVEEVDVNFVAHALRIIMLYLVTNFCMNAIYNIYKGIGKTVLVNIVSFFCFLVIPVTTCLTLPRIITNPSAKIDGVWTSWLFPEVLCFIALVIYSTIKRRKFPRKLTEIAYLPESFGIESSDRYDATITTVSDVSGVSQNAIEFCRSKNMDSRKSYYCGLCIEELAVTILEHGNEKKRKSGKEIDLRMIYENESITILLRDNYPHFDPLEWTQIHEPEDPMRYVGVRMATKLAQEVNYSTALNLNVLTIRI